MQQRPPGLTASSGPLARPGSLCAVWLCCPPKAATRPLPAHDCNPSTAGPRLQPFRCRHCPLPVPRRLWDVEHRRLVYNCDLLTPSVSASLVPTHAAVTGEQGPGRGQRPAA